MSYLKALGLAKEPFSNSPSPDFFYASAAHARCLVKLEISLRLRRGLSIVLGDVGTGKTTMCRRLVRILSKDRLFALHILLDPYFPDTHTFLLVLHQMIVGREAPPGLDDWHLKERIKTALLKTGVEDKAIVVLVVDEGQKITDECLELLREFLNYETNDCKLLQIIVFAQSEFANMVDRFPNVADRINELRRIGPLSLKETKALIRHRLERAKLGEKAPELFTPGGYKALHKATGGYPRKLMKLSHKVLLTMLKTNSKKASASFVHSCVLKGGGAKGGFRWAWAAVLPLVALLVGAGLSLNLGHDIFGGSGQPAVSSNSATEADNVLASAGDVIPEVDITLSDEIDAQVEEPRESEEDSTRTVDYAPETAVKEMRAGLTMDQETAVSAAFVAANRARISGFAKRSLLAAVKSTKQPFPHLLGSVTLGPGDSLVELVSLVYGEYRERYLDLVIDANPQLERMDAPVDSARVVFPVILSSGTSDLAPRYWLHVARYQTLDQALERIKSQGESDLPVYLTPYMSPSQGLVFSLVAEEVFLDEASAREAVMRLSPETRERAVIMRGWENGVVIFASTSPWNEHRDLYKKTAAQR